MSVSNPIEYESATDLYSFLCHSAPSITQAWFHRLGRPSSGFKVTSIWSVRDPVSEKQRKFLRFYWHSDGELDSALSSIEDDCVYMSFSPSGKRFVKFFQTKGKNSSRRVEIWNNSTLERTILCTETLHGSFYFDEWFGGVSWSPDEDKLLYLAEQPADEAVSFFAANSKPEQKKGEQYVRQIDFGETYTGKKLAALFVLDMRQIYRVEGLDYQLAVSEPQWSPDGNHIVFIGRYLESYPMGVKYCYNRPSILFLAHLVVSTGTAQVENLQPLTNPQSEPLDWCVRSPRFHPSGDWIIYLSTPKTPQNVHNGTSVLRLVEWKSCKIITLIDVVYQENDSSESHFPGLYLHALPNNPWQDQQTLLLDSVWNCQSVLLQVKNISATDTSCIHIQPVNISSNRVENIFVLDVLSNNVLLNISTPICSSYLCLIRLSLEENNGIIERIQLGEPLNLSSTLEWITPTNLQLGEEQRLKLLTLSTSESLEPHDGNFQAFIVYPRQPCLGKGKKMSLICFPHGGPHSSHLIQFHLGVAFLALRGYAILMVNYRGSLGRGQQSLNSLIGKIGYQDVEECVVATEWARHSVAGLSKDTLIGALGGSHGGFLSAHLTSQYPSIYRAAVLRNPVTNIVSMHSSTDIRDWCFTEIGCFQWKMKDTMESLLTNPQVLERMWKHSPISHIQSCQAPTLLLLGGSDRRVPPSQGIEWHQILLSKQIPTKLLWYPDSDHSISDSPCSDDAWIHTLMWFDKYLRDAE